jgi:hypothetical protein
MPMIGAELVEIAEEFLQEAVRCGFCGLRV